MSSDVHFACTGCGKCCDTPPTMTFPEALGLYREFILTIRLAGPIVDARLPASNPGVAAYIVQREHLLRHGAQNLDLALDAARHFDATVQINAGAIRPGNDDPCPQLNEGGLCAIYDRRPQRCRIVPFDYFLPEPIAIAQGAHRLHEAVGRGWKCDISDDAPVVAHDGAFTAGLAQDAYRDGLALVEQQEAALAAIVGTLQQQIRTDPSLTSRVVGALGRGEAIDFSFLMLLDTLHEFRRQAQAGKMPDSPLLQTLPSIADFLTAQLPLIDAAIARNIGRKRAQDRPATERLRVLKSDYTRSLAALQAN